LPTFLAPLPGDSSFKRMSDFLYRNQVRNAVYHAAILGRIDNGHGLVHPAQAQSRDAGLMTLESTVLALDQRDL